MGLLSTLFGGDDSLNLTERALSASAKGSPLVSKALVVPTTAGRMVSNDSAEAFLRDLPTGGGRCLTDPYRRSWPVMRAIKIIAEPIASAPLRFAVPTDEGPRQLNDPDLAGFWERPAVGPEGPLSRAEVIEATVGWLKLQGEAFWLFDDGWLTPRGSRNPFVIARPDQMRPFVTQDGGQLLGWGFRDAAGRDHKLLPEQVYHPKFWNPYDNIAGLGEYLAAAVSAEGDVLAQEFQRNLMQGNGDRGQIVSVKGGVLSDAQRAQIEAALRAKAAAARDGRHQSTFLSADVSVSDPAIQQADSDFVSMRVDSRKEIFLALGVPTSYAEQQPRATTAHNADRLILIEDTCMPLAAKLAGTIVQIAQRQKNISGRGGQHLIAYFDFDGHTAVMESKIGRVGSMDTLCKNGVPVSVASQYLGMKLPRFDGDDVSLVPSLVQTLDNVIDPPEPVAPPVALPKPEKEDPTAKTLALLSVGTPDPLMFLLGTPGALTVKAAHELEPATDPATHGLKPEMGDDTALAPERVALWNAHMKARRPLEKKMETAVRKVMLSARSSVLAKLESTSKTAGQIVEKDDDDDKLENPPPEPHPGAAVQVMYDPVTYTAELTNGTARVARAAMQVAGDDVRRELGIDDPWTMPPAEVLTALRERENLLKNTSQKVFEEVQAELEAGFQAGETTAQLADRVRAKFRTLENGRAETIAVTETGAAYGGGRESGASSVGYKTKSWLSAHDNHVRPTHQAADGQKVDARGVFKVGSDSAPYPCAEGMSAAEACNCRCIALYHT